jgi:hypothetical protein
MAVEVSVELIQIWEVVSHMEITVRRCHFDENRPFSQHLLPLVPQAIGAEIRGEAKIESGGNCCYGTFQVRAMVFIIPDSAELVLSGVGLPRKAPILRLNPPAGADAPLISVKELDQYELRLGLCRAINTWMGSRIGRNFRCVFPGLDVIPPAH